MHSPPTRGNRLPANGSDAALAGVVPLTIARAHHPQGRQAIVGARSEATGPSVPSVLPFLLEHLG
jgi:hypothetical protein